MSSDGVFFFLVFGFFFLLWIATGGPARPISFAGPFITPITGLNQTQTGYGKKEFIGSYATADAAGRTGTLTGRSSPNASAQDFGTPSPYKGMVTLGNYAVNQNGTDPSQEYIQLYASSGNAKNIDITGWKLVSTVTNNNAEIPVGVKLIHQGSGNLLGDVILSPGDSAYIVTGRSSIGLSFKENECMGYFGTQQNLSLSLSCPSPVDDFNSYYPGNPLTDDSCYSFVQSVNQCQVPNQIPSNITYKCLQFVTQHLTYNGCVATHVTDPNFYGTTWHVYLNDGGRLWKSSREQIKLLDASGKTVDMITY